MNWKPFVKTATLIGPAATVLAVSSIIGFEGYLSSVAKDPIGRLEVCYGHDDPNLTPGQNYSPAECEEILASDVLAHAQVVNCVDGDVRDNLTPGEKAALVSLAYNVGVSAVCKSTFVKKLNEGQGTKACSELNHWIKAGGKDCSYKNSGCYGIYLRRQKERTMCESD